MVVKKTKTPMKKRMRKPRKTFKRKPRYQTNIIDSTVRPQRLLVKFPYFTSGQLSSAVGSYVGQLFNLNSLYDPDRTGTGHQPLGVDQYATFYNRYRVYKVDYVLTLTNADPAQPCDIAIAATNQALTASDESVFENPNSYYVSLAPRDGSASRRVVKGSIYLPRVLGQTGSAYKANENTSGVIGTTSPNELLLHNIIATSVIDSQPVNVCYSIKYVFHTELFDADVLPIS